MTGHGVIACALALLVLGSAPARAAFEEAPLSPRAAALGGAMTAVDDDAASLLSNPAALAPLRRPSSSLDYLRQFDLPAGKVDQDQMNALGVVPVDQDLIKGAFGFGVVYDRQNRFAAERQFAAGFATRNLFELDDGAVDLGGTIRALSKTYDAGGGVAHGTLDAGLLYRFGERYALGLSLLDLFRPRFRQPDGFVDHAPLGAKLGFSESVEGFLLAMDLTQRERSGRHASATTAAAGVERWWATPRAGSFALRTGLSLGDRDKTWSWGLGWRMMGAELSYAMTVPMMGATIFGHCVSLSFRFGVSNPEGEYERVLSDEMRYRKQLTQALEQGEVKQWRLAEELNRLRDELQTLHSQLADKTLSEEQAQERLKELERERAEAQRRFEQMQNESQRLARRSQQMMLDDDWNAYLKTKLGGAPDAVLIDQVRRILAQYKDKGVDLSAANQELLRLLRASK